MYLLRGLLNIVQDYAWETQAESQAIFYMDTLVMLTAAGQEYYIYHADGGTYLDLLRGITSTVLTVVHT